MAASKVVVCMCGLPGAGKSTLASLLRENLRSSGLPARVVRFDDALDERTLQSGGFSVEAWRGARNESFEQLAAALSGACGCGGEGSHACERPLVVVVDDNMHLPSMRREVYVVAREAEAALLFVYVQTPVEVAIRRNEERVHGRVDPAVIEKMNEAFTPPGSKPFETHCYVVVKEDTHESDMWAKELQEIMHLSRTIPPLESLQTQQMREMERKQAGTHESVRHEIDLSLRKWISQAMSKVASDPDLRGYQRQISAALIQAKKDTLTSLRGLSVEGSSFAAAQAHEFFVQQVRQTAIPAEIVAWLEQVLGEAPGH